MSSMGRWPAIVACVFLSASVEAAAAAEGSSSSPAAFVRPLQPSRHAPRGPSSADESSIAGGGIASPPPPRSVFPLSDSMMNNYDGVDGGGVWFLALVGAAAYLSGYASEGYDNHAL